MPSEERHLQFEFVPFNRQRRPRPKAVQGADCRDRGRAGGAGKYVNSAEVAVSAISREHKIEGGIEDTGHTNVRLPY